MNYSAEICRRVVDGGKQPVEAILEEVGISERVGDALISKLCGEGALRRSSTHIWVGNEGRARMLAEQAEAKETPKPVLIPLAAVSVRELKTERRPLPIPPQIPLRDGVPCPPVRLGRHRPPCPWPFATMKIGQSFVYDVPEGFTAKEAAEQIRRDAVAFRKLMPELRVAIRVLDGDRQVGVWREVPDGTEASLKAITGDPKMTGRSLGIRVRKGKSTA